MYGKRRVVLHQQVMTLSGKRVAAIAGGGSHFPIGFWYEQDGKLYVDLKSREQWYAHVNSETIANKGLGGVASPKELREFITAYHNEEIK